MKNTETKYNTLIFYTQYMRTKSNDISKKQKVLNHLQRYGSIDRMTALTHCKEWNLGHTIAALRKNGHDIKRHGFNTTLKYVLYNSEGEPVFSRYIKSKQTAEV